MNATIVIPARYASTRFPGKPLIDLGGKSMLQRVYEQAAKATGITDIIIATDDIRIEEHAIGFGAKVCMTNTHHQTGTDRCVEVIEQIDNRPDIIINVQGDEPFINPLQIEQLISLLQKNDIQIATLCKKIEAVEDIINPNIVKVVKSLQNKALYFSRQSIPYYRDKEQMPEIYYKHLGIYGFKTETFLQLAKLPQSPLEKAESLEQLRWLDNGYDIYLAETDFQSVAIDTPDDAGKALDFLKG
ncbi:MAG: 3-deoxy-manno-octulosonate cytidylyltransferase [Bacteroidota bacterium]|nr:3-deoxy-manno-octulosonate cytidylyltransferase [Bacteroidota bacterium]